MSTCIAFQNPIEGPVTNGLSNPYYKDSGMHTVHTWCMYCSYMSHFHEYSHPPHGKYWGFKFSLWISTVKTLGKCTRYGGYFQRRISREMRYRALDI
jgi:hypothetical protein